MTTLLKNTFAAPPPIGRLTLLFTEQALCYLDFTDNDARLAALMRRRYGDFRIRTADDHLAIAPRLQRYFSGDRDAFDGLPLSTGGTPFQQAVWQHLRRIPHGRSISYTTLAEQLQRPRAVRAAANANARNPIAIVIPCHRVIGRDGALRGYAGGEGRKSWLLQHEGCAIQPEVSGSERRAVG